MTKKEITDEELLETYKTQQERMEYLTKQASTKTSGLKKTSINDKFRVMMKYYHDRAEEGRERFTKKVKQQPYFQVQCPKCKISNRKWLESGGDVYDRPIESPKDEIEAHKDLYGSKIHMTDIPKEYYQKVKYQKQWIYLEHYCKRCKYYFP